MKLGSSEIVSYKLGNNPVSKIYLGATQVYPPTGGGGGGGPLTEAITGFTGGGIQNSATAGVGCGFTVGSNNLSVSELGAYVQGSEEVNIDILLINSSGTVIASATFDSAGKPNNAFYFAACTPVTLVAGQSYYLFMNVIAGETFWYDDATTVTSTADIAVTNAHYRFGTTIGSNNPGAGHSYGPVSFKYEVL